MALFIGVDGGATKTVGVLTEEENVLARCVVGPTNPSVVGESGCLGALRNLLEDLSRDNPVDRVQAIWMGIAGVRTRADLALMRRVCETLGAADKTRVSDDTLLALVSAGLEKCGIAVVAGTGSCVTGVNPQGDRLIAGGVGHLLGDEGSGYAVVVEALRAAARAGQNRGPQTLLLPRFIERLGVGDSDEMVRWATGVSVSDLASLAGLVFNCAEEGDPVAEEIIGNGAKHLAGLARHAAAQLGLEDAPPGVVLYGGMLEHFPSYFDRVRDEIATLLPNATVVRPAVEGAVAAARLARQSVRGETPSCDVAGELPRLPITETRNWRSEEIDRLSTLEMLDVINLEDHKVAPAVKQVLESVARAVDVAAEALKAGGRVIYVGAGTSGRIGMLDAVECPPTFGIPPETVQAILAGGDSAAKTAAEGAEDDTEEGAREVARREVVRDDVVVGIAASGTTPFVKGALGEARKRGAATVLVACNRPGSGFAEADIVINPVAGPEVITGSTRMKAATATKMVLNMISTAVMVKLGKVYGNLMVDVQARSSKLVRRACKIISDIAGVNDEEASELLELAGGDVKVAIIMKKLSVGSDGARQILADSGGILRKALESEDRGGGNESRAG
jgi:N-acetylmuramic acid 6-phosphate etherase